MKNILFTISAILFSLILNAQDSISLSDFETLNNTEWEGKLTYIDYQSGEPTSIDTKLQINIESNKIKYNMQYVYEPNKNNKSSVQIKKGGTFYGNEKVISNTIKNETRTIVTSYEGKDNGEKATMYITREFDETNLTISKKVILKNTGKSLIRNTYKFTKTN
ncbi:hypothetical protein [Algibacter aquimarinus]|uniref:Lipocalin-like domain-containing protein n=1 Tax=Algibacter aquimarinus TaxID=1136748 RepID=A0ABP9HLB8_9FLAO